MIEHWPKVKTFLEKYWKAISIFPFFLGGIWQFCSLGSISFQFIRYFSVTQLLADGLILSYFLTLVIGPICLVVAYISISFSEIFQLHKNKSGVLYHFEKFGLIIFYFLVLFTSFIIFDNFITGSIENIAEYFVTGFTFGLILFIPYLIATILPIKKNKLVLIIFIATISAFCTLLLSAKGWPFKPDKSVLLLNEQRIICKLKNDNKTNNVELKYFNDRYVFVIIENNLEILKFEDLFAK